MKNKDLLVLVADSDMRAIVDVLLGQKYMYQLKIREINYEIVKHPRKDPGVRKEAQEILKIHRNYFLKALILLDYEGCGFKGKPEKLENEIKSKIIQTKFWQESDVEVIVIYPELEVWVWGVSDKFSELFGIDLGFNFKNKPKNPKEEFEVILRRIKRPYSSSIFRELASKVAYKHIENCRDRAFIKFVSTIRSWFPRGNLT